MRSGYILLLLAIAPCAYANEQWECSSHDSVSLQWVAKNDYQRVATTDAFDACKKQSAFPKTCKTEKDDCELFIDGVTTRPMWRCTALDQLSKVWRSKIYRHRDDAAMAAKSYCHHHSAMPDTCYINLLMCHNLNEG